MHLWISEKLVDPALRISFIKGSLCCWLVTKLPDSFRNSLASTGTFHPATNILNLNKIWIVCYYLYRVEVQFSIGWCFPGDQSAEWGRRTRSRWQNNWTSCTAVKRNEASNFLWSARILNKNEKSEIGSPYRMTKMLDSVEKSKQRGKRKCNSSFLQESTQRQIPLIIQRRMIRCYIRCLRQDSVETGNKLTAWISLTFQNYLTWRIRGHLI